MVSLLPAFQLKAEHTVVLRPWAEQRQFTAQKQLLDAKGRAIGITTVQERTYIGHLEVLHPSSKEVLIELSAEVTPDPFAATDEDEADPAPELTALMERLTAAAAAALGDHAQPPSPIQPLGFSVHWSPKAALSYSEEGRPAIEFDLTRMDVVEAELFTQARVRFANPGISDGESARLSKLPGGLRVVEANPGSKVGPGDLLMAIDGQPALLPSIGRLRFGALPKPVKVRRDTGEITEILLP